MISEQLQQLRHFGVTDVEIARELAATEDQLAGDSINGLSEAQRADLDSLVSKGSTHRRAPGTQTRSSFGQAGVRIHQTALPVSSDARSSALGEVRSLLQMASSREAGAGQDLWVTIRLTFATRVTVALPELTVVRAYDELCARSDMDTLDWLVSLMPRRYASGSLGNHVIRDLTMNIYPKR